MKWFTRFVLASVLGVLASSPCGAQYLMPVGVRPPDLPLSSDAAPHAAVIVFPDSVGQSINRAGGIAGGLLGGALAGAIGAAIALEQSRRCEGDLCGLGYGLLGFAIGEPIGLAVGTHIGAKGHGNVLLSSFASFGLLIVGGALTAGVSSVAPPLGVVGVIAVPAVQISAALAIER